MNVSEFLLKFLVLLITAKLFAEIFAYITLPSVLGEVIAGILLGPSLLGIIEPRGTFLLLAEMGILLLLFEVGLETDVGQLIKVGAQSLLVAVTGVAVPGLVSYWLCSFYLQLSPAVSLFVGGSMVATSIGITVRVLKDLKKYHTQRAKIVLGAAVLDDVIGVVILALLYDFAVSGLVNVTKTLRILGFILLFLIVAPVITRLFIPLLSKLSAAGRTKGILPTLITSLILALAALSHSVGAPEILGSFAAGIALARRFFLPLGASVQQGSNTLGEKIEEQMKPIINLFVPVFFVIVGASINLRAIDFTSILFWKATGLLTVAAIASKIASGVWVQGTLRKKLTTGLAMVPRGEVGLIFAEIGKRSGIFDDTLYAIIVFVVALTTLFGPILLRIILRTEE